MTIGGAVSPHSTKPVAKKLNIEADNEENSDRDDGLGACILWHR
ncbi:hypothetical protein GGQ68_001658 [Sagittula marina]|uniref:Uncharacterized protein n=1 Tax=Sagittula marina TaxID=943940 RepID=A0A7W6DMJ1_9RHOB|nr:hypothetical protein [Sagittula marina]